MRLGILGGTFDPVHCGHLRMASYCLKKLNLHKIYFIPAGNPPHKRPRVTYQQRVEMLDLALEQYPHFFVSELEKHEQARNYTYTYYTLEKFHEEHPDDELFFLIGEDNVSEIPSWLKYNELFSLAQFVILSRPSEKKYSWDFPFIKKLLFIAMPKIDISSQCIRNLCYSEMSIHGLVPRKVEDFIKKNNLYIKEVT